MTTHDVMLALECCGPAAFIDKDCARCPLNGMDDCHATLCTSAIDCIMRERCEVERYTTEINRVCDALACLSVK